MVCGKGVVVGNLFAMIRLDQWFFQIKKKRKKKALKCLCNDVYVNLDFRQIKMKKKNLYNHHMRMDRVEIFIIPKVMFKKQWIKIEQ